MRIAEIQVTNLFGTFNHKIPLTNAERVTIIHGPNGFGKTVMLKMIAALIEGDTSVFERVPFSEFRVILEDGTIGIIRHREADTSRDAKAQSKLVVSLVDPTGKVTQTATYPVIPDVPPQILDRVDRYVPAQLRRSENGWRDGSGRLFYLPDILKLFPSAATVVPRRYRPQAFVEMATDISVFFVRTNRLGEEQLPASARRFFVNEYTEHFYTEEAPQPIAALRVDQYSRDVVQRIKKALADYAKHSQESDRTFPERLVRFLRENQRALPEREILDQMEKLEDRRQRLISLGFLDSESGLRDLKEEDVRRASEALTIYVNDVAEKLAVFDDLSQRVGTLTDIVNERFKYKKLTVHREFGFRIVTESEEYIQLGDLSSGEQHELVVLYELLFRAPRQGLVLVDEPEISLHVAWQSRFLDDLIKVLALTNSYGVVATHSPVIIGNKWDLAVELKGPSEPASERLHEEPH